jgi:cytochrome c biogenesis protein CcmG/thiol:disulfide interchange protein DsbE
VLLQLAQQSSVTLVGLNYKDQADAAIEWLSKLGNPYTVSLMDSEGRTGIDYGVYGVPETFVIDKRGVVRYKHTGAVTADDLEKVFMPLINQLEAEAL